MVNVQFSPNVRHSFAIYFRAPMTGHRTTPLLYVNGAQISPSLAALARPSQTLLSFLRDVLGLTGSQLGKGN